MISIKSMVQATLALTALAVSSAGFAKSATEAAGQVQSFSDPREWNFEVFLDDKSIGFHNFRLEPKEDGYQLQTEAEFEVDFLFFTAYRYEHENTEIWEEGCLKRIEARTLDNGDEYRVVGQREQGEFDLDAAGKSSADGSLESDCVRTFAYWDRDKLQDNRLLNAQTGEYVDVDLKPAGQETIRIGERDIQADRYTIDSEDLDLELWYSPDGKWLKLTSTVENGRQLRYQLEGS